MRKLLLLLLAAVGLNAQIALVSTASVGASAGGTATTSGVNTAGATLCVGSFSDGNRSGAYTITDSKGNTWHPLTLAGSSTSSQLQIFYAWDHGGSPLSVGAGHTFSARGSTSSNYPFVVVTCFSGTQTSSDPFDQQNTANSGAGTVTSIQPGSVTPGASNQLIVTALASGANSGTYSANLAFTITAQSPIISGINYGGAQAYLVETAAASKNPTWTFNSGGGQSSAVIATFRAGASPAAIKHRAGEEQ